VVAAEQHGVGHVGRSTFDPGDQVVGVGVHRGPAAAGETAAGFAGGKGAALRPGENPPGSAQGEGGAGRVGEGVGGCGVRGGGGPVGLGWVRVCDGCLWYSRLGTDQAVFA